MKEYLTVEQYFAAYPELMSDPALFAAATILVAQINGALKMYEADGGLIETNQHHGSPHFGTVISGTENGAIRPLTCPIGAAGSKHKRGMAVDLCDHTGKLDAWCGGTTHQDGRLIALGLSREHPDETINWCHLGTGPTAANHWLFHPV